MGADHDYLDHTDFDSMYSRQNFLCKYKKNITKSSLNILIMKAKMLHIPDANPDM
ncbi:hypothetical protein YDYSY3_38760 [Paenibacillus chitinolyticus]|nr:hypothetical protein YDYSY3_38760 [Paenibacillus chitinolyticus]